MRGYSPTWVITDDPLSTADLNGNRYYPSVPEGNRRERRARAAQERRKTK